MIYRRLWLLLLIMIFAVTAPAVVFYTAGYRWNPKKGMVERNGTLIFDTKPTGASIYMDGKLLDARTPLTRTDVAPGTYRIRLEREGYHPWEKTIEIRPERVTFVTDVWLWAQTEPTRVVEGDITGLAASPDGRRLAFIEETTGGSAVVIRRLADNGVLGFLGNDGGEDARIPFRGEAPTGTIQLLWDPSGKDVLVEDAENAWIAQGASQSITILPKGVYKWQGDTLVGVWEKERLTYVPSEATVRRTALPEGVRDQEGDYAILTTPNGEQIVAEKGNQEVQFGLPSGVWTFLGREEGWLLLYERARKTWLAFDPRNTERVEAISVPAATPPSRFRGDDRTAFLATSLNELWLVRFGDPAELLLRSSDALTDADWHKEGRYLFYSTVHDVAALGLDVHNGRVQTTLGSFERIQHMAVAGTTIYIAGQRNGQSGIWMLRVEP